MKCSLLRQATPRSTLPTRKVHASIAYPGYEEQKRAHTSFIDQLQKLKDDFEESGGSLTTILGANKMVLDWLTRHISTMDKKIGDFVRTQEE